MSGETFLIDENVVMIYYGMHFKLIFGVTRVSIPR